MEGTDFYTEWKPLIRKSAESLLAAAMIITGNTNNINDITATTATTIRPCFTIATKIDKLYQDEVVECLMVK
jgi:hypothetical protein